MAFAPPLCLMGFGPRGGGTEQRVGVGSPRHGPPQTPVSVYMPGSLQFTAPPLCAMRVRAATWGLSPSWDPPVPLLLPSWALQGSGKGGGGHRWPFSHSGFSKGYSPGWAPRLLLLSDTNSCHGWVWDGITLGDGEDRGMMLAPGPVQPPCHSLGVSLCQIPAGLPIPAGAVVMWLCPCGAQPGARPSHSGDPQGPFGPLPPQLSFAVHLVWARGGRERQRCPRPCPGWGCSVPGRNPTLPPSFFLVR